MAQYALIDGELAPVAKLGQRALCWDKACRWEMVARPGNGKMLPHWAHKPGSSHTYSTDTEKGEWHREVQYLFESRGAGTEVGMRSADGQRDHVADIVCADGRIVEAQTRYLSADNIVSREATYGDMCWIYDAHDTGKWFITNNPNDPAVFSWGKPDRAFMLHSKPIYFDTGDGIWILEQMFARHRKGNRGHVIYEGRRRKVAADLLAFVDKVSAGATFGARARMTLIDPRKNNRGVKFRTLMDVDEWADKNATCDYDTFVLDEEAERKAEEAEAARLAGMMARYESKQQWIRKVQDEANRHLAVVPNPQPQPQRQADPGHTDWSRLAGMACNCRIGCTGAHWGDAGICDPNCRPCRIMAGVTYTSPSSSRKSAQ